MQEAENSASNVSGRGEGLRFGSALQRQAAAMTAVSSGADVVDARRSW
jgi:hypothetical protein